MPRGDNRVPGRPGERFAERRKGPISQRDLVRILPALIDAARAKVSTRTRDDARDALREVLAVAHWQTPHVLKNLNSKRCRWLTTRGYVIPTRYLRDDDYLQRIALWRARQANG